ncbi:MAG: hypothetical protein HY293_02770, partial [Planctomycetes bacterium]|nr:hypothetical protein [Planctomycetota bacterium]
MRIVGLLTGALTGVALIFTALHQGGFGACCGGGPPPTSLGIAALHLSEPGFYLACQLNSWGLPEFLAMTLGGALPGAIAGLGLAEL